MQKTEYYGLDYVLESEESTTKVSDYRRSTSSNFQLIDSAIHEMSELISELQKRGVYLCSADEMTTLEDGTNVPNIETPDSSVVYLVSSGDAAPNMWLEYIWVDKAWEQWGSTTIDLTGYATDKDVDALLKDLKRNTELYTDKKIETALLDAAYYTDDVASDTLGDAIKYTKTSSENVLSDAKEYADMMDFDTLVAAREYAVAKNQGKTNAGSMFYVDTNGVVTSTNRLAKDFWAGKHAIFFGTSITDYCKTNATTSYGEEGYTWLLTQALGMEFSIDSDNYGVAGAITISPGADHLLYDHVQDYGSIYEQIVAKKSKIAAADVVFIETATNDFKKDVELGEYTSGTSYVLETFYGALQGAITKIRTYNPNALIVLLADTRRAGFIDAQDGEYKYYSEYVNNAKCTLFSYVDAMSTIASNMGTMFCDWYHNSDITEGDISLYTWDDQLHLNEDGYANVADLTTRTLLDYSFDYITIPQKVSELENDSGYITSYTETDPTVPAWAKAETKPSYTHTEVGAAAASHNQSASTITAGTFAETGIVAQSGTDYSIARIRNIKASTVDLTAGTSTLANGDIYLVYE